MGKKKRYPIEKKSSNLKYISRVFTLCAAYLMEEENWDEEKICDFYSALIRWSESINSHLISIDKVKDIIKEKTGMEIL